MSKSQQQKGVAGERELCILLRCAGYPVEWGGSMTYGTVPDLSGLPGIHIECKRRERLNITEAIEQSVRDAERFGDGAPAVFHRKNNRPWLVTMRFQEWLHLYATALSPDLDHDARARFFTHPTDAISTKGEKTMNYWETEEPLIADTGKNIFRYFPISRKLNISKPDWKDKRTGETKQGKTVAIDLNAAATSNEAMSLLTRVLTDIKKYSL